MLLFQSNAIDPVILPCPCLSDDSSEDELSYLTDLRFLSPAALSDIMTYRKLLNDAEKNLQEQFESHEGSSSASSSAAEGDFVDWDVDWESSADVNTGGANRQDASSLNKLIEDKLLENGKLLTHFKDEVGAAVRQSMRVLLELVDQFEVDQTLQDSSSDCVNILIRSYTPSLTTPSTPSKRSTSVSSEEVRPLPLLIFLSSFDTLSVQLMGVCARIVSSYSALRAGAVRSRDSAAAPSLPQNALNALEFIESPLQQMKRAGLGLLTQGFSRFGFSSSAAKPSPADQPVLILFVLGGLTFKEVGQVKAAIGDWNGKSKVVLMSTCMTNNECILFDLFS